MTNQQWQLPPIDEILDSVSTETDGDAAREQSQIIEQSLADLGVPVQVRNIHHGPRLTQFSLKPGSNAEVSQIKRLEPDLAVALAGALVQIEEPTVDYPYIMVVVRNEQALGVKLRQVLESPSFIRMRGAVKVPLGIDTFGRPLIIDLASLPHLLIGGTTGSGKSTCLHGMIAGLLCTYTPAEVQLLLIDPLRVELERYQGIPHLVAPVVTQTAQVLALLRQTVEEIERRYQALTKAQVRDIATYNGSLPAGQPPLPYLLVMIDNLFDLMLNAPKEIEQLLTRIAQKARGAGIHLVLATLRSNVATISGSIKANFPARIAFRMADRAESQLILDTGGAEMLFGHGDMLFKGPGTALLQRLQGIYVSEYELNRIINFWRRQARL
jgi:DNA segregation ATPase FtsK/SpoIIIE, S-DNA-T family